MTKVTFVFTGIGMGNLKGDVWRVIFPFDAGGCHKVLFDDASGKPVPLNVPKTRLLVETQNVKIPTSGKGTNFDKIFDLTGVQVHNSVSLKSNWDNSGVLLEIPNAVMSMKDPMKSLYNLKKGSTLIKPLNIIAFSAKAEIELLKDGYVKVSVNNNEEDFPRTYTEAEGDKTIVFDNNCDGNPSFNEGDLEMLYNLILNDPPEGRFAVERILGVFPSGEDLEKLSSTKGIARNTGKDNHNPEPLAPVEELPCYFTVASKIDNF
jgi:hypothetical protein